MGRGGLARALALVLLVGSAAQGAAQPSAPSADRVSRLVARGDALRDVGDTISALGLYRDAVSVGPRRPEGYAALGALHLTLGEPARAREVFEVGVRAAPGSEALWLGLARARRALGAPREALEALRTLQHRVPGSRTGLEALAETAEAQGAFVEALGARRALHELLAADPSAAEHAAEHAAEQRMRVRALERLIGVAERVRGPAACAPTETSPVLRALGRCP